MDNSEMFLVGHLKFYTTDLPSKRSYYLVSSILLDFPEKDCYKAPKM